ncbi:hypothetical protein HPB51_025469 [Rhipicephalus microplus]|uniref:Uncharacterized protein n=1 Tax=Rhipicephalus microplus TaxID=6941 RepID=A0A9J6DRF8_RHIMP|nr:hypothetical protein HPB51_025469 [Rhipicephalus microplus]
MPCLVNLLRPARFTPNLKTPTMKTTTACTSVPVNSSDFSTPSDENEIMGATQSTLSSKSSTGPRVHDMAAGSSTGTTELLDNGVQKNNAVYYRRQVSPNRLHAERETRGTCSLPGYRAFQTPTIKHKRQLPKGQAALLSRSRWEMSVEAASYSKNTGTLNCRNGEAESLTQTPARHGSSSASAWRRDAAGVRRCADVLRMSSGPVANYRWTRFVLDLLSVGSSAGGCPVPTDTTCIGKFVPVF